MATSNNKIEIYQNNDANIGCVVKMMSTIPGVPEVIDVSGFTPYLTVKKKTGDIDTVISKIGTVIDASGTLLFILTSIDTSINYGEYVYDITIEKDTTIYTPVKDKFVVVDGVRH